MRRGAVLAALLVLAGCSIDRSPQGDPVLPDLVPVPVTDIRTRLDPATGTPYMLFTGVVANLGRGDFLLDGRQVDDGWEVSQRIVHSESGEESRPTPAIAVYGGDGHGHWHIARVVQYHLEPEVGTIADHVDHKVGFCFFDSDRAANPPPGSPDEPVYSSESCGEVADRDFQMGLSVGWVDTYPWFLEGQEIDLTGVPGGRYRIVGHVDPEGWFVESDTSNNVVSNAFTLVYRESDGAPVITLDS